MQFVPIKQHCTSISKTNRLLLFMEIAVIVRIIRNMQMYDVSKTRGFRNVKGATEIS
jgi:hypothetical protein